MGKNISVENKVDIGKNQVKISRNTKDIEKNADKLELLSAQFSWIKRIVMITFIFLATVFLILFVNGMLVHYRTGINSLENSIF